VKHTRTFYRALVDGAGVVSCWGDIWRTDHGPSGRRVTDSIRGAGRRLSLPFALIALTALAMGTRNAAVRKPDLTTTVLTLTITGIGADSSLANGKNPRLARRVGSVVAMFLGAALGGIIIRYSISAALALATAISVVCSATLFRALRASDDVVAVSG
jgi:uncharacterized membrane protein YoaK (UPF0700 family)